jgi:hypothetical protein
MRDATTGDDVGYQLVARVEALALDGRLSMLSAPAYAVLLCMAHNAHDSGTKDAPRSTYFRGWEHLARVALRRPTYDRPAHLAVARAVRELTDLGLIKRTGRRGETSHGLVMYELTI